MVKHAIDELKWRLSLTKMDIRASEDVLNDESADAEERADMPEYIKGLKEKVADFEKAIAILEETK